MQYLDSICAIKGIILAIMLQFLDIIWTIFGQKGQAKLEINIPVVV